jgi:P63C domain
MGINAIRTGRAKGGEVRALKLSKEERKAISQKGVLARRELAALPRATHGSTDHPLIIGDVELPCFVLNDDTRVLSQRGFQTSIGMSSGGGSKPGEQRLVSFLVSLAEKAREDKNLASRSAALAERLRNPIKFRRPNGGLGFGFEATLLADLCDVILEARKGRHLQKQQERIASQAELLVRGFARVGIIALVDEATGFQKDREKDALAKILEAFVAKEIQPYLKTFPPDYYEELFRLYALPYPPQGNKSWRPGFFGHITNEVVYSRLAPELLPELKKAATKAERKSKLHQWLTQDIGHPKLREHLASIVSILKLSNTPEQFRWNVNKVHPRYGKTREFDFTDIESSAKA